MCGIVGIGNFNKQSIASRERAIFQNLLVANSARGVDGTGILKIEEKGKASWAKAYGNPFDLFRTEGFDDNFWDDITSPEYVRWLIGHNRYATTGQLDTKSAHPFQEGNIILIHNGTVRHSRLKGFKDYPVDSQAIAAFIDKEGLEATLDGFDGAYALVYYDSKEKTLNLIRNWERPLFLGANKKESIVVFGSEEGMVQWACHRNQVSLDFLEPIETGVLYQFSLDKMKPTEEKIVTFKGFKETRGGRGNYVETGGVEKAFWSNGERWVLDPKTGIYEKQGSCVLVEDSKKASPGKAEKNYKNKEKRTYLTPVPPIDSTSKPKNKKAEVSYPTQQWKSLKVGMEIEFDFENYEKLENLASPEQYYLVEGHSPKPEISDCFFKCRIKGTESLDALMQADMIQGKIVAIQVPYEIGKDVTIFCAFPAPFWTGLPKSEANSYAALPAPLDDALVPESALRNLAEGE